MDKILVALENSLNEIDQLDRSVQGDVIDNPSILATKVNSFVASLLSLSQSGKTMDSEALFPVPIDLFEVMDEESGNPAEYLSHITKNCNNQSNEVSRSVFYLKELQTQVHSTLSQLSQENSDIPSSKRKHDEI